MVPSDSTVRYLEESVIVGHSQSGRYKETIPAQVLGGKDLERLNSLSVADALRYFSGVQLKDYGGVAGLKTVNVRSLGTNHVAVFYDGIQLGNAQNGQTDLGRFSLDDIGEYASTMDRKAISSSLPETSAHHHPYISLHRNPILLPDGDTHSRLQ